MVVLYTTGCSKCKVLESKLNAKKIEYSIVDDINVMERKGFMSVPVLEVDGEVMMFKQATDWVNKLEEGYGH